jgi:hypothetical protein
MAFQGKCSIISKTVINDQATEKVKNFKGSDLSHIHDEVLQNKLIKFQHFSET